MAHFQPIHCDRHTNRHMDQRKLKAGCVHPSSNTSKIHPLKIGHKWAAETTQQKPEEPELVHTILNSHYNLKKMDSQLKHRCKSMSTTPGQRIQNLADELEKHLCDQLGKPRPAGVLRRMKVNQLVSNVNKSGEVLTPPHRCTGIYLSIRSPPHVMHPVSLRFRPSITRPARTSPTMPPTRRGSTHV